MKLGLDGKVALVTGSTRGVGKAIAEKLLEEGCYVLFNGRHTPDAVPANGLQERASFVRGDVATSEGCRTILNQVMTEHTRLDILICNVGSGASVPPGKETATEWRRVFDVNLFVATTMIEVAWPALCESRGAVLCISSICGQEVLGAPVTYSAAKAALNAFVRGISRPLGAEGVRVNALAPGNILFEGSVWDRKLQENPGKVDEMLNREVALKRLGNAGEIADIAAFLVSDRASFVTGEVLVADGGQVRS